MAKLNLKIADQYQLNEEGNQQPQTAAYGQPFGEIDFGNLQEYRAEELVALGFPYLEKTEVKPPVTAVAKAAK